MLVKLEFIKDILPTSLWDEKRILKWAIEEG